VITSWRIVRKDHAANAFDGEGARLHGGRWNLRGTPMIYTSQSASLCALEILVHLDRREDLHEFVLFACSFPASIVEVIDRSALHDEWRDSPPLPAVQEIGDRWIREGRSAVLQVPSAVIETESNYLFNPAHAAFTKVAVADPVPFSLDLRPLRE
jgi:RES domain-containing protein